MLNGGINLKELLSMIYPLLVILIPSIIYQIFIIKKKKIEKPSKKHLIWVYIFLLYIFMSISVAGIGSVWDIGRYETIVRVNEINIIPFASEGLMTYILNIIMFMPLGFLLPLLWEKMRDIKNVILTSFCFSLSLEVTQLFNRRNSDIDDLIMNVLGAIIGFIIYQIFKKVFRKKINHSSNLSLSKNEPIIYLLLSIVCTFLLCK